MNTVALVSKIDIGPIVLWYASVHDALTLKAAGCLNDEELARANRYRQASDRDRFLAGWSLLRHALTQMVSGTVAPAAWSFRSEEYGKPQVAEGLPQLQFNISHSSDIVVAGVSEAAPIGVDVECLVRAENMEVVEDLLSVDELAFLHALPEPERWGAFIRIWVVKEASSKALGLGLSMNFREMTVSFSPLRVGHPAGLLAADEKLHLDQRTLNLSGSTYVLCVAMLDDVCGRGEIHFRSLEEVQ